jgi:hypothetical protein
LQSRGKADEQFDHKNPTVPPFSGFEPIQELPITVAGAMGRCPSFSSLLSFANTSERQTL